jgi:hypothetical protein
MISVETVRYESWDNSWSGTLKMWLKRACSAEPDVMVAAWRKKCGTFSATLSPKRKLRVGA